MVKVAVVTEVCVWCLILHVCVWCLIPQVCVWCLIPQVCVWCLGEFADQLVSGQVEGEEPIQVHTDTLIPPPLQLS